MGLTLAAPGVGGVNRLPAGPAVTAAAQADVCPLRPERHAVNQRAAVGRVDADGFAGCAQRPTRMQAALGGFAICKEQRISPPPGSLLPPEPAIWWRY